MVYAPGTQHAEIRLGAGEASTLQRLGSIGDALPEPEATDAAKGGNAGPASNADALKAALLAELIKGHDVKSMSMKDLHKLLGDDFEWMRRPDVNSALDAIEAENAPPE